MSDHFIQKCRVCEKVLMQCRCMAPNKRVELVLCPECSKKKAEKKIEDFKKSRSAK